METKSRPLEKKQKQCFSTYIKKQDSFGIPISLTKKGKETHQTVLGGFITIITSLGLLCYFLLLIQDIYKNKTSTVVQAVKYLEGFADKELIVLNNSNFDFAVRFYNYNDSYQEEDYNLYVNIQVSILRLILNDDQQYDYIQTMLPLKKCGKDRFLNNTQLDEHKNISEKYLCVEDINITLEGNFFVGEGTTLTVQLFKCSQLELEYLYPNQNKTCKSDHEVSVFLQLSEFELAINQQYFDEKEFDKSPIKSTLVSYWNTPSLNVRTSKVLSISNNQVTCRDSTLSNSLSVSNYNYYSSKLIEFFSYDENFSQYTDSLFNFYIGKSSDYYEIERTRETIWDVLSEIGGLIDIIFMVAGLGIKSFQTFCYQASLFKALFLIEIGIDSFKSIKAKKNVIWSEPGNATGVQLQKQRKENFVHTLLRRVPLKFYLKDFLSLSFSCFKMKNFSKKELFEKASKKLEDELDIVKILKQMQKQKIFMRIVLKRYQRKLLQLNMKKVIKSQCCEEQFQSPKVQGLKRFLGASILQNYLDKLLENSKNLAIDEKLLDQIFEKEQQKAEICSKNQDQSISENFISQENWLVEDVQRKDITGSQLMKH